MIFAKLIACGVMAFASVAAFRIAFGKSWEHRFHRFAIVALVIFKIGLCVGIYQYFPQSVTKSDAVIHYYPQTIRFMEGEIPYRDFPSSYSIFFLALLSLAVGIWKSPGSIVLLMILFETGLIVLYLWRCHKVGFRPGWRTAYLYLLSPISFYWIGVVG